MAPGLPEVNPEDPAFEQTPRLWLEVALQAAKDHFHRKITDFGEHGERVMSFVMLQTLDDKWKDHLYDLDHLKASIGFRGWGQKDPLVEYKKDAYEMFVDLMTDIRKTVTSLFFRAQMGAPQQRRIPAAAKGSCTPGRRGCPGRAARYPAFGLSGGGTRGPAGLRHGRPGGGIDDLGVSRSAATPPGGASPRGGGVPTSSGPDPRQLQTNRGEERKQAPVIGHSGTGAERSLSLREWEEVQEMPWTEGLKASHGSPSETRPFPTSSGPFRRATLFGWPVSFLLGEVKDRGKAGVSSKGEKGGPGEGSDLPLVGGGPPQGAPSDPGSYGSLRS